MEIKRLPSSHPDFSGLVRLLDLYLARIDGEEHSFYNQFNDTIALKHCIVAYDNGVPVGCGAIKRYDASSYEVKRMFVHPEARGKGIAQSIVVALENWALELGAHRTILETGKRMPDAVGLYLKMDYVFIENYGQYQGVENSICFEKKLS